MYPLTCRLVDLGRNLRHPMRRRVFRQAREIWQADPRQQGRWQQERLADLLIHARETTSFYAARIPDDDTVRRDPYAVLTTLPVLDKSGRIAHHKELVSSRPAGAVYDNHTGGSTGQMLHFLEDEHYRLWSEAIRSLCFELCGYRPGDRQVFLWGADADVRLQERLRTRIADALTNTRWVNTFDLDDARLDQTVRQLERWQPGYIWAYASSAALVARRAENLGAVIRPAAVQTTAEVLYPEQRALIERVFACRVFDRYGSRESSIIAHETAAHDGLHLVHIAHVVELLDEHNRPVAAGHMGRIVITSLHNRAQPFIRYDTGDLGVAAPPTPDGPWPVEVLMRIVGRSVDLIRSPGGQLIHGEFFTHLFYGEPEVRQFQVVQKALGHLHLRVVPAVPGTRPPLERPLRLIREHSRPPFEVTVEYCEAIPPPPSGKRRFVISELNADTPGRPSVVGPDGEAAPGRDRRFSGPTDRENPAATRGGTF